MKSVNKLFGKHPHISVIEFDAVSEFVQMLVGNTGLLKPSDITVVYLRDKVTLDELKAKIPNLDE